MQVFYPKSKLYAQTKSGIDLGKVVAVEIDELSGKIQSFHVASSHVLPRLLDSELIIGWKQIIDWQDDKIIVTDTVVPSESRNIAMASSKQIGAQLKDI